MRKLPIHLAVIASAVVALCYTSAPASDLDAYLADARLDAITCEIAKLYNTGAIDAQTYTHLHAMRTEAARAVTRWKWAGRDEHVARACLAVLEGAVPK